MTSDRPRILKALQEGRSVREWSGFPDETKRRYEAIAALFPNFTVKACGSRVDGHYIDEGDSQERLEMRSLLGKRNLVSDYDFVVDHTATPIKDLPPWADRLRPHISHGLTIEVPRG